MENSGTSPGSSVGFAQFLIPNAIINDLTQVFNQKEEKFALVSAFGQITFRKSLLYLTVVNMVAMVLVK